MPSSILPTIITTTSLVLSRTIQPVHSHGYLTSPRSRNLVAHEDGKWWIDASSSPTNNNNDNDETTTITITSHPVPENCPHCLNWGGTLARCGIAAEGLRNYDTPMAASFDPTSGEYIGPASSSSSSNGNNDDDGGGGGRMPFVPQAIYTQGETIDITTTITTYHKGHFEFKACPLQNPLDIPTQECFDKYPLEYVEDLESGAKRDENYPERAYLGGVHLTPSSPSTAAEGENLGYGPEQLYEGTFLHRFVLPEGLTGDYVLLQWHWLTANSCVHPGYVEYYEQNPSLGEDLEFLKRVGECPSYPPDGKGVPEQFWNCAEIRILPAQQEVEDDVTESSQASPPPPPLSNQVIDLNNDGAISLAEHFVAATDTTSFITLQSASESMTTTMILEPTDDAVVLRSMPTKNFSGRDGLKFDGKPVISSLVKFDLSSLLEDDAVRIRSATLKLFAIGNTIDEENGVILNVIGGNEDWDEETVTWDTAPYDLGPRSVRIKSSTTLIPENTWYEVDFTEGVLWTIEEEGQSFITIKIGTRQDLDRGTFASKEYNGGMYSPKLIVEVASGDDSEMLMQGSKFRPNKKKPNKKNPSKKNPSKARPLSGNKKKPSANKKKPLKKDKPSSAGKNKPSKNKPSKSKSSKNKTPKNKPSNKRPSKNNNTPSKNKPPKPENMPSPTPPSISATSAHASAKKALSILDSKEKEIDNELFLYQHPSDGWVPSTIYKYDGLAKGLKLMHSKGVAGMTFFLGDNSNNGYEKGLTNVAAFLAQSMKETIKYDACDENSWDLIDGRYPLSNACGQLGQSYQDYHCPPDEKHMECPVDKNMEITAATHAKWYGAPAPLFCRPKSSKDDFTGGWDYGFMCNVGWVDPPLVCDVYEGQKAGRFDNSEPVPNRNGRTDVEGCCWWGRGVIQTTGVCNFGKLNYYLGKRAADEGRDAAYPKIDFCKDPEIICSSKEFQELKWIAGMFYWMESVQKYDAGGWNYMEKLAEFVDGGFSDPGFINAVSGIVNRGCHNPPCGTGAVDGGPERYANFVHALITFGLIEPPEGDDGSATIGGKLTPAVSSCGSDWRDAEKCSTLCPSGTSLECKDGEFCFAGVTCPDS